MKITLITDWTPTEDNFNGPSAHLYHLLLNRPEKEELLVFSTNLNKVTPEMIGVIQNKLCTKVICHKLSFLEKVWRSRRIQYKLDFFRKRPLLSNSYYKIPRKYERQIRSYSPDLIWIYTQSLIGVAKQFSDYNLLITGADCFPLHYSRILRDEYSITNFRYKNFELSKVTICTRKRRLT